MKKYRSGQKSDYEILNAWMHLMDNNICIVDFFIKSNFKTIAIYGSNDFAKHMYEQICKTVDIKFFIGGEDCFIMGDIDTVDFDIAMSHNDLDIIVVTETDNYDDIESRISAIKDIPIVSIEDIIFEFYLSW